MTAGLIKVMPTEIWVVTDNLCLDAATGSVVDGAQKLFIHGGKAAIFSYGSGPPDVQQKIKALDPSEPRPETLARALRETFRAVYGPHLFGVFVAGFDGADPSLWHMDVPVSEAAVQDLGSFPTCFLAWGRRGFGKARRFDGDVGRRTLHQRHPSRGMWVGGTAQIKCLTRPAAWLFPATGWPRLTSR